MKRFLASLAPPSFAGLFLGASFAAFRANLIPDNVWMYLWPALVSLLYLSVAIAFFTLRLHKWIWPFLAGFVVQTICILFIYADKQFRPVDALYYSALTVCIGILVVLIVIAVAAVRSRLIEVGILNPPGALDGDQEQVQQIRDHMKDALAKLRKAGLGGNAIYELPWFLVAGCSGVGKTVAIRNSGLGLPVKEDRLKGVGGTHTTDYFFTYEMIFLDTPGAWTQDGLNDSTRRYWLEIVTQLRRNRGRRPLDGMIVVVPADHLLTRSEDQLRDQAGNIREIVDLVHEELRFRFPVYVLVSKCDLVEGFVDFFRALPAQRRNEILGWSNPDPEEGDAERLVMKGMRRLLDRLAAYRLELLTATSRISRARRLYFFPDEFRRLEEPLAAFTDELFRPDRLHQAPIFRGFYFSSGTQGEGSPIAVATADVARRIGLKLPPAEDEGDKEPKRPYFLLDLFKEVVVGDGGLVARTARHWWRRRRGTALATFLPAAVAVAVLLLSLLSLGLNASTYRRIRDEVPGIRSAMLTQNRGPGLTLRDAGALEGFHRDLTGFSLFRGAGMRSPGTLPSLVLEVLQVGLHRNVLAPMVKEMMDPASAGNRTCTEQLDLFRSVTWLVSGNRSQSTDDELRGVTQLLRLDEDQAKGLNQELAERFSYLVNMTPPGSQLLPGISLAAVAKRAQESCAMTGSGSSLDAYRKFQEVCADGSRESVPDCYDRVSALVKLRNEQIDRVKTNVNGLARDLGLLARREADGAKEAVSSIESVQAQGGKAGPCAESLNKDVLDPIATYLETQSKLIEECAAVAGDASAARKKFRAQDESLAPQRDGITTHIVDWNKTCKFKVLPELPSGFEVKPSVFLGTTKHYHFLACTGKVDALRRQSQTRIQETIKERVAPPSIPTGSPRQRQGDRPKVPATRFTYLETGELPPRQYTESGLPDNVRQWKDDIEEADDLGGPGAEASKRETRAQAEGFLGRYRDAWGRYLANARLVEQPGRVPDEWLEALAGSGELQKLLEPVTRAQSALKLQAVAAPEFTSLSATADALELGSFANQGIGVYLDLLRGIAQGLKDCREGNARCAGLNDGSPDNKLVQAQRLVDTQATSGLVHELKPLLTAPLEIARRWLSSPDRARGQWALLQRDWNEKLGPSFPFRSAGSADASATREEVAAVLGWKNGSVHSFPAMHMEGASGKWIAGALEASKALFDSKRDGKIRLKLTIEPLRWEPEDLEKKYRVQTVKIILAEGAQFEWKNDEPPDPTSKTLEVDLFPDPPTTAASIRVAFQAKRNMTGWVPGVATWGDAKWRPAAQVEGFWAPIGLLESGNVADGGRVVATYDVPIEDDSRKPKILHLTIRAEAEGLGRLLQLRKTGMEAPPDLAMER